MASPDPEVRIGVGRGVGAILSDMSLGLFALYIILVLADVLPIRLIDPLWLISFAGSLCNTLTIPLAGLAFLHVAAALAPGSKSIEARRIVCGRLAAIAALGFLLLLPLLGYANWRGIENVRLANQRNVVLLSKRTTQLAQQISSASTPLELQSRMVKLQGPLIPDAALGRPLSEVKREALAVINAAQKSFKNQIKGPFSQEFLPIYKQSIRSMAIALAGAFCFSAGAWNPQQSTTVLQSLLASFGKTPFWPGSLMRLIGKKLENLKRSTSKDAVEAQRLSEWRRRLKESDRAKKQVDWSKSLREREMKRNLAQQRKLSQQRERQRQLVEREARRNANKNNRNP